jgi:hypothetical protein
MPKYTSHIYIKPTKDIFLYLRSHPILSNGLFHIQQLAPEDTKDIARNGLPEGGLIVVREVCDPSKPKDSHDEAQTHENRDAPVLSWWDIQGSASIQIIPPNVIPTLGFGKIYNNHSANLPPPIDFLRFLKNLSATYDTVVAFYHHYTAYEDRLADAEYA